MRAATARLRQLQLQLCGAALRLGSAVGWGAAGCLMPRVIRLELAQAGGAAQDIAPGDAMVTLGRGRLGMPHDEMMLSREHAAVGWERGVPVVRRLGRNQVGVRRHGERLRLQGGARGRRRGQRAACTRSCAALEDGDELFFLLKSAGLRYTVAIVADRRPDKRATAAAAAPASDTADQRPPKRRRADPKTPVAGAPAPRSAHCGCELPAGGGDTWVHSLPPVLPPAGRPFHTLLLQTNTTSFESQAREYFARSDNAFWCAAMHSKPQPTSGTNGALSGRFIAGLELKFDPERSVAGQAARFDLQGGMRTACRPVPELYRRQFEELDPPHPQLDYSGQLAALGEAGIGLWTVLSKTQVPDGHSPITATNSTPNNDLKAFCAKHKIRRLVLGEGAKCAEAFAKFNADWMRSGELKLADDTYTSKQFKQKKYGAMREASSSRPMASYLAGQRGSAAPVELAVCHTPHGRVVNTGKAGMTKEAAFAECRESYSKLCFSPMKSK